MSKIAVRKKLPDWDTSVRHIGRLLGWSSRSVPDPWTKVKIIPVALVTFDDKNVEVVDAEDVEIVILGD